MENGIRIGGERIGPKIAGKTENNGKAASLCMSSDTYLNNPALDPSGKLVCCWNRRGQQPPAGQSNSSHNLRLSTGHCQLLSHLHRLKISLSDECSMWHRSSTPQPHPAVLPHLQHPETPTMAQCSGCPQEALGICGHCSRLRTPSYSQD